MTPHDPNRADLFAAYVQGELDSAAREAIEPPQPNEFEWNAVRNAVHRGIVSETIGTQTARQVRLVRRGLFAAGSVAAAIAIAIALFTLAARDKPNFPVPNPKVNEQDDFAVLPLATENDVEIERIAGSGHGLLFGDAPLALAREDDVLIEETEPHPAWPGGSPKMIIAAGDAPMIYAAKAR